MLSCSARYDGGHNIDTHRAVSRSTSEVSPASAVRSSSSFSHIRRSDSARPVKSLQTTPERQQRHAYGLPLSTPPSAAVLAPEMPDPAVQTDSPLGKSQERASSSQDYPDSHSSHPVLSPSGSSSSSASLRSSGSSSHSSEHDSAATSLSAVGSTASITAAPGEGATSVTQCDSAMRPAVSASADPAFKDPPRPAGSSAGVASNGQSTSPEWLQRIKSYSAISDSTHPQRQAQLSDWVTGSSKSSAPTRDAFQSSKSVSLLTVSNDLQESESESASRKSARRASSGSGGMTTPSDEHFRYTFTPVASTSRMRSESSKDATSPTIEGQAARRAFDRKYSAEQTRPARRKMHRVDEAEDRPSSDVAHKVKHAIATRSPLVADQPHLSARDSTAAAVQQKLPDGILGQSPQDAKRETISSTSGSSATSETFRDPGVTTAVHEKPATMNIASFPTLQLLHLLAELLTSITQKNDASRLAAEKATSDDHADGRGDEAGSSGQENSPDPQQSSWAQRRTDPVTPAVPLSTPTDGEPGNDDYPFPRSAMSYMQSSRASHTDMTRTDALRDNFSSPAASPSSRLRRLRRDDFRWQETAAQDSLQKRTILTSAAAALAMPNATLCFHARNIPSISIESYLIRISKYCPTTNEVFLSLLVYFDRMSRLPDMSRAAISFLHSGDSQGPKSNVFGTDASGVVTNFMIDSFNVHRLLIAGVTVASKFFSDVFYTNSRYAKVGGLPLAELNALELQLLLLNNFDLLVQADDIQRYGDSLLEGRLPPHTYSPPRLSRVDALLPDISTKGSAASEVPLSLRRRARSDLSSKLHGRAPEFQVGSGSTQRDLHDTPSDAVSARPKTSFRSASESSTSASESSTVVPSESSIDTERAGDVETDEDGEIDAKDQHLRHNHALERDDDSESSDGDHEMERMSNLHPGTSQSAPSLAPSSTIRFENRSHTPTSGPQLTESISGTSNARDPDGTQQASTSRKTNSARAAELQSSHSRTREWMLHQQQSNRTLRTAGTLERDEATDEASAITETTDSQRSPSSNAVSASDDVDMQD